MPLNEEQQRALDSVVDGHNVFITGGAGVGKSFLVSHIVDQTPFIAVTAMTGCAALLIGGTTLHSHLGIGLAKDTAQKLALLAKKYPGVAERIINMHALLIDEVSMLSDELFEKVSEFLKIMKRNKKPFGGVQLILVGDPFQLCPVEGSYCFTSPLWEKCEFKIHRLESNMRQQGGVCVLKVLIRWTNVHIARRPSLQRSSRSTSVRGVLSGGSQDT
jgi:ATP-dependent DNA helicase PIF1